MSGADFLLYAIEVGLFLIMAGVAFGFVRLLLGPTLADRVVALDMITVNIIAFCALYAIKSGTSAFLDVAVVLALVGFMSTAALARYAERQMLHRSDGNIPSPVEQLEAVASRMRHTDEGDSK